MVFTATSLKELTCNDIDMSISSTPLRDPPPPKETHNFFYKKKLFISKFFSLA